MTEAQQIIAVAIGACTLLGLLVGYIRWWAPRWRRIKQRFDGAVDVLFGRPAIVDPASGRVVSPKLPSLGERLVGFDQDVEALKQTVAPVAEDVAQVRKQVSEAPAEAEEPTTLREDVRIMSRFMEAHIEWSQEWTSRIDAAVDDLGTRADATDATLTEHGQMLTDHASRIAALEAHRCGPEQ